MKNQKTPVPVADVLTVLSAMLTKGLGRKVTVVR